MSIGYIINENKRGDSFVNKSNIKFLVLLLTLVSCAPSLRAMNNEVRNEQGIKFVKYEDTLVRPKVSSVYYGLNENIHTFRGAKLDVFALCCSMNLSFNSETDDFDGLSAKDLVFVINNFFGEFCELELKAYPGVEIKWRGKFNLLGCQATDNETVEISVGDQSGDTYTIVGKSKLSPSDRYWHFYVKDLNIRENHIAESLVYFKADYDENNKSLYHENLSEFRQKFRRHMLENIVRFLTCNRSFAEVKQLLMGRKYFAIDNPYGGAIFFFMKPVSLRLYNNEKSLEIEFDGCSKSYSYDDHLIDLTMNLSRNNDQAFWDPRIISLRPHK